MNNLPRRQHEVMARRCGGVFKDPPHIQRWQGSIHDSLCESLRVSRKRVLQRRVLHLGELNTTQLERWQRTIEVVEENGRRHQMRLFTDRHGERKAAGAPEDVAEGIALQPGGAAAAAVWSVLGRVQVMGRTHLGEFWQRRLGEQVGAVAWEKVVELLVVNRLIAPRSELSIHEKWFSQTAMSALLDTDEGVAEKDRLYRALDRIVEHKEALEEHLSQRWKDLFGATFDVLLYDLTSTYFEGEAPKKSTKPSVATRAITGQTASRSLSR